MAFRTARSGEASLISSISKGGGVDMKITDVTSLLTVNAYAQKTQKSNSLSDLNLSGRVSDMVKEQTSPLSELNLTGRVSDMVKGQASSGEDPVPVQFGLTVQKIKTNTNLLNMGTEMSTALARMKTIAGTDMSKLSNEDQISMSVDYKSLQWTVQRLAERSGLSAQSKAAATGDKPDVIAEALETTATSSDAVSKLAAALKYVDNNSAELETRISDLYSKGKTLAKTQLDTYGTLGV